MQKFSYHTHTNFSDGKNSVEDMIEQAVKLGWEEIGISDHMIVHKNINRQKLDLKSLPFDNSDIYHENFKDVYESFQRHAEKIRKISNGYPIKVKVGYEVDFFNYEGWFEAFKDFILQIDHDYLISGNHFLMSPDGEDVYDMSYLNCLGTKVLPDGLETYLKKHFDTMRQAVESKMFLFLAHIDYVRRLQETQNYPMRNEKEAVLNALSRTGTGCELSTKGLRKSSDFYPTGDILEDLVVKKVQIVISDDAHNVSELGYSFERAEKLLEDVGCQSRLKLK